MHAPEAPSHDPWPLQGARLTGWRSSMLDAVPGLPGALVDPDAAPLVLYSPGVSGIRFWWGPLEKSVRVEGTVERIAAEESDEYF